MTEVWLRTNRLPLIPGAVLFGMCCIVFSAVAIHDAICAWQGTGNWAAATFFGFGGLLTGLVCGTFIYWIQIPRLAYVQDRLLVYVLNSVDPIRVPIDIVECFFLGQGPSDLPKLAGREPETQNVIVRLAESAADWKHREVKPAFGHWCEGYITIRGAWCERITPQLMKRLNHRLAEIHRERKAAAQEGTTA
jgi:hypothetical protein